MYQASQEEQRTDILADESIFCEDVKEELHVPFHGGQIAASSPGSFASRWLEQISKNFQDRIVIESVSLFFVDTIEKAFESAVRCGYDNFGKVQIKPDWFDNDAYFFSRLSETAKRAFNEMLSDAYQCGQRTKDAVASIERTHIAAVRR